MKKRVLSILLALAMICMLVPTTVFAADDMHPELAAILNDEGKLELDYIQPDKTNNSDVILNSICNEYNDFRYYEGADLGYPNVGYTYHLNFSEDYSTVLIELYEVGWDENGYYAGDSAITKIDEQTIEVVWAEYNPDAMDLIEEKMATFPAEKDHFEITVLEYLNVLRYVDSYEEVPLAECSSELKAFFDNKFSFSFRPGLGESWMYFTKEGGDILVQYDGAPYYVWPDIMYAQLKWALYIPEGTADTVESWTAAAQKVLDDYFGEGVAKIIYIEDGQNFERFYKDYKENAVSGSAEEAERAFGEGGDFEFITHAVAPENESFEFVITIGNLNAACVVIEDDSKIETAPVCTTADLKTNVQIETTDPSVPLDTKITVEQLTSGTEHEKVVTALEKVEEIANVETSVSYDISLFSETLNDNITKLDNGTFKVSLPIPEELEGKDLAVYYVDDDGNATPYDVEPVEGYAVFETNHFSTYTLVEIKKADSGAQGEAVPQPEEKPVEDKEVIANTADATQVMPWMVTMVFATVGCGVVASKRKEIE